MRLSLSLEIATMALLSFVAASPLPTSPTSPTADINVLLPGTFQHGRDVASTPPSSSMYVIHPTFFNRSGEETDYVCV